MALRENQVRVSIMMDDETENAWVRVHVFSSLKPTAGSYQDIPVEKRPMERWVEAAGAAMAERVNTQIGDNMDPWDCAKAAVEAYREAQAKFRQEWDGMRNGLTT